MLGRGSSPARKRWRPGAPSGQPAGAAAVPRASSYSDVEYEQFALVVELDGRAWHDGEARDRDRRRDNQTIVAGRRTLRYGWADINARPCATAAEVLAALRLAGWIGAPTRCSAACGLPPEVCRPGAFWCPRARTLCSGSWVSPRTAERSR